MVGAASGTPGSDKHSLSAVEGSEFFPQTVIGYLKEPGHEDTEPLGLCLVWCLEHLELLAGPVLVSVSLGCLSLPQRNCFSKDPEFSQAKITFH